MPVPTLNPNADPVIAGIIEKFNLLHPVSSGLREELYQKTFEVQLRKNAFLLREGMVCNAFYFICKGIVRGFSSKRQRELTTWISEEGEFVSSISGMYRQVSKESIQAVEACVLVGIHTDALLSWYDRFPEMNVIARKLLERYYQDAQERSLIMRIGTAREKYDYFAESRPGQLDRVPLGCIASFLGITEQTLERIQRKEQFSLKASTMAEVVCILEKNMESQELFKIKGISMSRLSLMLAVPAYTLSYVFNHYYKKRFADFINGYRVDYVKQQLSKGLDWQKKKIEAIGEEAGFASRSTFFAAFRKQEGSTPGAYATQLY